jgi:hypothetical protein
VKNQFIEDWQENPSMADNPNRVIQQHQSGQCSNDISASCNAIFALCETPGDEAQNRPMQYQLRKLECQKRYNTCIQNCDPAAFM